MSHVSHSYRGASGRRLVGKALKPSGQAKAELLCGAEIPGFFLGGTAKARYGAGRVVYRRSATGAFLHIPIMWLQISLDKSLAKVLNVATLNKELSVNRTAGLFHDTHPTAAELCNVLGPHWAICANTEKNRQRYGRCLSQKAYQAACQEALELREFPNTTITERTVFGKNFGERLIAMRRA